MWHKVLIPSPLLIIPVLVMTTKCHVPKENPDVIVINSKHADMDQQKPITNNSVHFEEEKYEMTTKIAETIRPTTFITRREEIKKEPEETAPSNEEVVFIPHEKEILRKKTVEDYWKEEQEDDDKMTLHDLLNREQKINDIKLNLDTIKIETEKPNEDIIFITGKNSENVIDKPEKNTEKQKPKEKTNFIKHPNAKNTIGKLNCTNLDCNNNLSSVCGGKMENREWKYRLFLNECYFRKVNCYFKKKENRYQEIALEKCDGIAVHGAEPYEAKQYQPQHLRPMENGIIELDPRRSARRTLTRNIDGRLCSHPCPTSCPEQYDPECAVSGTGQIRVFMNHCKMDWNSCSYGIVWHRRPLADCVGGKKADMRQNRGFINWMQSVGIVDNKGRLVLE